MEHKAIRAHPIFTLRSLYPGVKFSAIVFNMDLDKMVGPSALGNFVALELSDLGDRHRVNPARPEGLAVGGESIDRLPIVGEGLASPIGIQVGIGLSQFSGVVLFVVVQDRQNARVSKAQTTAIDWPIAPDH
jgi:hypothetical protein